MQRPSTTRYRRTALAAALGFFALAAAPGEGRPKVATLRELVAQARRGGETGSLALVPAERLALFRRAVRSLASGGAGAEADLATCGFEAVQVKAGRPATLLRELAGNRAGGGVYALASTPGRVATGGLVLGIPHSFFDRRTGTLGVALFEQGLGRALACNTVHRRRPAVGDSPGETADVAHGKSNFFHAATLALAEAWPGSVVVQLHGFEPGRRRSAAGAAADFVLADGGAPGGEHALLERAAAAFEREFGRAAVAMHGRDTTELGATGNVQGRALNALAAGRFLHVEISGTMRERLVSDAATLAKLRKALASLSTD
jgi:hypothetical protein